MNSNGLLAPQPSDEACRRHFAIALMLGLVALFWGVWWGWPTSFDQHDPTPTAIRMLWDRTLDPGLRYWGAFGYQEALLLAVMPVAALNKILGLDFETVKPVMYLMTRLLWALQATAMLLLAYALARDLFRDRRAGVLAMYSLALAPGFVAWAHIPQLDLPHGFWYAVAAMLTASGWRQARPGLLFGAAVAAGLAAGVKYVGGIVVLAPMLAIFFLRPPGRALSLSILLGATALGVFMLTTPLATGAPLQWIPEYLADVLANGHREMDAPLALWTMPGAMANMLGPALALLLVISLVLFLVPGKPRGELQAWAIMAALLVPYYLSLSWQHVATVRYVIPLSVPLVVLLGTLVSRGLSGQGAAGVLRLGVVAAAAVQLVLVTALVIGFSTDTRTALVAWMEEHAGIGAVVETTLNHRPYFVGPTSFTERGRPHFQAETAQMHANVVQDEGSATRRLMDTMIELLDMDHESVLTWVDKERRWLNKLGPTYDTSVQGPLARGVDYVVINRNTAQFYVLDWPGVDPQSPHEKDFLNAVLNETGPYRRVARFEPVVPAWLRYPRELWFNLSPPIDVFAVDQAAAGAVPAGDVTGQPAALEH